MDECFGTTREPVTRAQSEFRYRHPIAFSDLRLEPGGARDPRRVIDARERGFGFSGDFKRRVATRITGCAAVARFKRMGEIAVQEPGIAKQQNTLQGLAVVVLGWTLILGGIAGLLLPVVPGVVLLAVGAFLLNARYAWLRRAMGKWRSRFPALERALSKMERGTQPKEEDTQAPRDTRKVLIFAEDIEELSLYAKPFEALGVEVHKCASIESAMRCVEREEFDFALVDQVSPAFEGIRIIRHLIRYNSPMPLIVLAQITDMNCLHQAKELGAHEYLEKPVSTAKMNEIIERFLANPSRKLRNREVESSSQEIVPAKMR